MREDTHTHTHKLQKQMKELINKHISTNSSKAVCVPCVQISLSSGPECQ